VLGLDRLELDGNLLAGDDVGAEVNIAEGAGTDLAADTVLVTDAEILCGLVSIALSIVQCRMPTEMWRLRDEW